MFRGGTDQSATNTISHENPQIEKLMCVACTLSFKKAKQSSGERIGLKKENIKKIEFHDSCQKNGKKRSWMAKTRLSLNRTGTSELCINLLCAGSIRC